MKSLTKIILLFLLPLDAGAAVTVKTVKSAGGDYTTLSAAEADMDGSNIWWNLEVYGGFDAGCFAVDALTHAFSENEPCKIYAADSARHGGTPATPGALIVVAATASISGCLINREKYVWIDGLSFAYTNFNSDVSRYGVYDDAFQDGSLSYNRVSNCLFYQSFSGADTSTLYGVYCRAFPNTGSTYGIAGAQARIWNNTLYGGTSARTGAGILFTFNAQTGSSGAQTCRWDFWNNSCYNWQMRGFRAFASRAGGTATSVTLYTKETNNVAIGSEGGDYLYSVGTVSALDVDRVTSASGDTSGDDYDTGNLTGLVYSVTWESATDLTPKDGSALINAGATTAETTDAIGYPRRMGQLGLQDIGARERSYRRRVHRRRRKTIMGFKVAF
jgi:hypothetical protein